MTASPNDTCCRFDRWLTAYIDDELDAVHCLEVEDHLHACEVCACRIAHLKATRVSLQDVLKVEAPASLMQRLSLSLDSAPEVEPTAAEEEPCESADDERPTATDLVAVAGDRASLLGGSVRPVLAPQLVKLRYVVPLAAAATLALVFGATKLQQVETASKPANSASQYNASMDSLLEDLVADHVRPRPVESTDPDALQQFHIGLKVRAPRFEGLGARYVGARIHQRADQRTGLLQYELANKQRMTIYVFNPRKVRLKGSRLAKRHVGPRNVYVGKVRGFSIAAAERNGIGYVMASDLDDEQNAKMLVMAAEPK